MDKLISSIIDHYNYFWVGFMVVAALASFPRRRKKIEPINMVRHKMLRPRRNLRKKYIEELKREIKQRLSDPGPEPSDPYLILRNAQVGRRDGWQEYLKKEKRIRLSKSKPAYKVRDRLLRY